MTAPESKKDIRSAMADNPKLDGIVVLILDRLFPALNYAMNYGKESFPDELTPWMNGAIFGAVATFMDTNHDKAQLSDITWVYACISDVLNTTVERYGSLDLDRYTRDLLVRAGADEAKMD